MADFSSRPLSDRAVESLTQNSNAKTRCDVLSVAIPVGARAMAGGHVLSI
jgi:hypothetical protein